MSYEPLDKKAVETGAEYFLQYLKGAPLTRNQLAICDAFSEFVQNMHENEELVAIIALMVDRQKKEAFDRLDAYIEREDERAYEFASSKYDEKRADSRRQESM